MTLDPCTIHASGVFSLFSAIAFAQRTHKIEKVVYFDRNQTFNSKQDFLDRCEPIFRFFSIQSCSTTYAYNSKQAADNYSDIYSHRGSRVLFAESLQSADNQKLISLIAPREIHFYAEGAMSYGPIRGGLPHDISERLKGVHYVDYGHDLSPIAIEQFGVTDRRMSNADFADLLESFFRMLDQSYGKETEINEFLSKVPANSIALVHQNLSAIAGFESKSEATVFRSIQNQIQTAWSGGLVIFMHPKGVRAVPEIFEIEPAKRTVIFALPKFPFVEYYISRMHAELTVGIFSTSLLNLHCMNLPVMTVQTESVGNLIKSKFDSNLYALHYVQLILGSYEHENKIYPSMDISKLRQHLSENNFTRCSIMSQKLWRLPYYISDSTVLRNCFVQAKVDMSTLKEFHKMPAFRRLAERCEQMLTQDSLHPLNKKKQPVSKTKNLKIFNFIKSKLQCVVTKN